MQVITFQIHPTETILFNSMDGGRKINVTRFCRNFPTNISRLRCNTLI